MKRYHNPDGDTGIARYEYGKDWISIEFKTGSIYEYTTTSLGEAHLETMKRLADSGDGLNTYINVNRSVWKGYSRKIR